MQPSGPAGRRDPTAGGVTHLTAFSATEAWRRGDRSGVYRTGDGTQWTCRGHDGGALAVGASVTVVRVRVTTDGGQTWQSYPTTMPPRPGIVIRADTAGPFRQTGA
jgi:hypothetical protein